MPTFCRHCRQVVSFCESLHLDFGGAVLAREGGQVLLGDRRVGHGDEVGYGGDVVAQAGVDLGEDVDLWERPRRRLQDFAAAIYRDGCSALYDMRPDGNPILDRTQGTECLYWAVGSAGTGSRCHLSSGES